MSLLSTCKPSSAAIVGVTLLALGVHTPATAATLSPAPLYDQVASYRIEIPNLIGPPDEADVYYPVVSGPGATSFPIALFLQGALVDRSEYSNFARIVASYGFGVVVPNHTRTLFGPTGAFTGFFPEQQQINTVLSEMTAENSDLTSPVAGLLDINKMVLLGHSFGGAVGLAAIQGNCVPSLCTSSYTRPAALVGGAFYGTSFFDPRFGGTVPPINNDGIPIALIAGSRDGVAELPDIEATYNQIQDPTKALITVEGANHYSITNQDSFRDPNRATLDRAVATETIARWSALFLRATVLDDPEAYNYVFKTGDALDSNVTVVSERVPEPTSVIGLLGLGAIGVSTLCKRKQRVR